METKRRRPHDGAVITIRLDPEATAALNAARVPERISKARFAQVAILRELRRTGYWPPAEAVGAVR